MACASKVSFQYLDTELARRVWMTGLVCNLTFNRFFALAKIMSARLLNRSSSSSSPTRGPSHGSSSTLVSSPSTTFGRVPYLSSSSSSTTLSTSAPWAESKPGHFIFASSSLWTELEPSLNLRPCAFQSTWPIAPFSLGVGEEANVA